MSQLCVSALGRIDEPPHRPSQLVELHFDLRGIELLTARYEGVETVVLATKSLGRVRDAEWRRDPQCLLCELDSLDGLQELFSDGWPFSL